jgi:dihydropteroate synthase
MPSPTLEDRPLVMAVLNVTPDSFSDGGRWFQHEQAVTRGHQMIDEGADIVDVGGESTRPGAAPVSAEEELRRVIPVVAGLAGRVRVSIDTTKEEVAEAAVAAGASLVNDVSASLWPVAARHRVGWVAMHRQGTPTTMQRHPHYDDVVAEDNLALLGSLDQLVATGFPVMVGTSRKSFLGSLAAAAGDPPLPPDERLPGSLATATWAMTQGAGMVRVHDVSPSVQAAVLVGRMGPGRQGDGS